MHAKAEPISTRIELCGPRERRAFARRWAALRDAVHMGKDARADVARLIVEINQALNRIEARRGRLARVTYPDGLPVSARREDIARAIREHPVVVVCGETGSGKTTQLPKILLELGYGFGGMIGHTQPRRIAARSVATRLAEELGQPLGDVVGYKVRFGDHTGPNTCVKVMTDGVLLAETAGDRDLLAYDAVIIDEAHERSLNIDFLLGYLRKLLPRRPDLKVVITSATIDPERFARHFAADGVDAPILRVSGRTYPVEIEYRPPHEQGLDERDEETQRAIVHAIDEACSYGPGDVLVFLSGEREIRETAESLEKHRTPGGEHPEVVPLYARLSADEQMRVFKPHQGRRVVLATNVAETSLTVPGIRYVVDTGVARLSRYSPRTKLQRLEIEAISRASADQRAGRCGRLGPGVCIRLYAKDDYDARPAFTDPEIRRTSLASVILQMAALNLGAVEEFPFLDPPDARQIKDGYDTLLELGAISNRRTITDLGRHLARLPIDPHLGRMLLASLHEPGCCLGDVLVIVAALAVQDPRERPMDKAADADAAHARFRDLRSDFLGFLRLWDWWQDSRRHLSGSKLRRACKEAFISFVRMREWEDTHRQLAELIGSVVGEERGTPAKKHQPVRTARAERPQPPPAREEPRHATHRPPLPPPSDTPDKAYAARVDAIHRALLPGLLANLGRKGEQGEYAGTRGAKWHIFPGSALFRAGPPWAMAAEIVRTTRVYARSVGPVEVGWIEHAAAHLVSKSHFDPHWDARAGRVMAFEKVTLFGLELVARRRVHFGPIDPAAAREVFIRGALVEGAMLTKAEFFERNMRIVEDLKRLEIRSRRAHLLADPWRRAEFYEARVPAGIVTTHDFERWHDRLTLVERLRLIMTLQDAAEQDANLPTFDDFPDMIELGSARLPLEYRLEPGAAADGVTIRVPAEALSALSAERFAWLVPGHLREKVEAMLRGVPKETRRLLPPPATLLDAVLPRLTGPAFAQGSLAEAVRAAVKAAADIEIPRDCLERASLPDHLRMRFEVLDDAGKPLACGRDLAAIRAHLAATHKAANDGTVRGGADRFHRDGLTQWDLGDLPERVEVERFGTTFVTYPGLVDAGQSVSLRLFEREENARTASRAGLRRLFMLDAGDEVRRATHRHPEVERLVVSASGLGNPQAFRAAFVEAAVDRALGSNRALPRSKDEFTRRSREAVAKLPDAVRDLAAQTEPVLRAVQPVLSKLAGSLPASWGDAVADVRDQLSALVPPDFLLHTPPKRLAHLPRYLAAIDARLRKLTGPGILKDRERAAEIAPLWKGYRELLRRQKELALAPRVIDDYRWLVEELRVSTFAQELGTAVPVSVKRLHDAWERIVGQ
ncbi:MAG: ATP-dependent helicase [Phycisphaerae bacterium]|nr:MAG: ATP-dependent helicase [Phycisphaerae bacterium]